MGLYFNSTAAACLILPVVWTGAHLTSFLEFGSGVLNSGGFDCWSDRLLRPHGFLHLGTFGLGAPLRRFRRLCYLTCLTAFS